MGKIFAIDPNKEIRYVPKAESELSEEEQTVFILKPLNAKAAASLQDDSAVTSIGAKGEDHTMHMKSGSTVIKALEKGLTGWENFKLTESGPVIEFEKDTKGKPQPEMLDYIPSDLRRELAEVITTGKSLTEVEAKNSD